MIRGFMKIQYLSLALQISFVGLTGCKGMATLSGLTDQYAAGGSSTASPTPTPSIVPTQLIFTTPPTMTGNTDSFLAVQPTISAKDNSGISADNYTGTINIKGYADSTCSTEVPSSVLSGSISISAGLVSFSGVKILKTNVVAIKATDNGSLTTNCLSGFTISPGALSSLSYSTAPSNTSSSGAVFLQQPAIIAKDANSNTLGANTAITLSSSSGALSCTTNPVLTNSSGMATFAGCKLTAANGSYNIIGTSSSTTISSSITIAAAVIVPVTPVSFTSCPAPNYSSPFLLPTTCIETLAGVAMNPIAPFDNNSGTSYTFALSGTLPAGLTFNATTGLISGTPTAPDLQTVQICQVVASVTSTTNCQSLTIATVTEVPITGPLTVNPALCSSVLGSGTNSDPIKLSTVSDFNTCVRNYPARSFSLIADIDFTSNSIAQLPSFNGILDGQNHTISHWSGSGAFFAKLAEGSIVRNLNVSLFTTTGPQLLASYMQGAIVHHVNFLNDSIYSSVSGSALLGQFEFAAAVSPSYQGYIDQINISGLTIVNTAGGWAWSAGVLMGIIHTPFRISNINFSGTNTLTANGNSWAPIVATNAAASWGQAPTNSALSNLWIDHISIGSGTTVTGGAGAFVSGLAAQICNADVITNAYSQASVSSSNIGIAGLVGTAYVGHGSASTAPSSYIVNSYFSGSLVGAEGAIAGSNYGGGSVTLVNTAYINTITQPVTGSISLSSSTNAVLTDAQFKNATQSAFSTWLSPPWTFVNGSYPSLP